MKGTPYEIGHKRGWHFRHLIKSISETRLKKVRDRKRKMTLARYIERVLERHYPELVQELKGMADGARISYDKMLLLNAWWDKPSYCSNVALTETKVGPVLGSSLDIGHSPYLIMMHYRPKRGHSFLTVCSPDFIGAARAMNDAGLCLCGSTTKAIDEGNGFPRYTMCRVAMQYCSNVGEVAELFGKFKEGFYNPGNYMFVDRKGDAMVIEQTNKAFVIRRPQNEGIACTNHYITPEAQKLGYDRYDWTWLLKNSRDRYQNLLEFIASADRNRPIESLQSVLRSHGTGGICQHGGEHELCATVAFVMSPRQKGFYVSQPIGFYCQSQFIRYDFLSNPW